MKKLSYRYKRLPSVDVVDVGHEEIEVPGLQASGQLLELSHNLDPPVNATKGFGEVTDC